MSSTPSSTKRGSSRRRSRGVNRSTRRAMDVRRAETIPGGRSGAVAPTADSAARSERPARAGRGPAAIPRGLEMLYIRHDLRRMIFTAAALFILMLALLIVFSTLV